MLFFSLFKMYLCLENQKLTNMLGNFPRVMVGKLIVRIFAEMMLLFDWYAFLCALLLFLRVFWCQLCILPCVSGYGIDLPWHKERKVKPLLESRSLQHNLNLPRIVVSVNEFNG